MSPNPSRSASPVPFDPARERYVSLATFRKNGREVRTPVWIAPDRDDPRGRRSFVYTNAKSGKVKRIRANGRARLAACDVRGKLLGEGVWIDASARVVEEPVEVERGFAEILHKYGWQMHLALLASRLSGRYADRCILGLELNV
jgi:PPOX class probable F420-dependent enzyme